MDMKSKDSERQNYVGETCPVCSRDKEDGHSLGQDPGSDDYVEIVRNTFNVKLIYWKNEDICRECVRRLRDAQNFKELVLEAEKRHLDVLSRNKEKKQVGCETSIIVKIEPEEIYDDESNWEIDYLGDDFDEDLIPPKLERVKPEIESVFITQSRMTPVKSKPKKRVTNIDSILARANIQIKRATSTKQRALSMQSAPLKRREYAKPKALVGKLLNSSKSSALVSKLLAPGRRRRLDAGAGVGELLRALGGAGGLAAESGDRRAVVKRESFISHDADKRYERQQVKRNVMSLLAHTTATPFINNRGTYKCLYCREQYFVFRDLHTHVREVHLVVKKYYLRTPLVKDLVNLEITDLKCRKCDEPFPDIETIKEHLLSKHKVQVRINLKEDCIQFKLLDVEGYKCHLCPMSFHVFRNLTMHMNEHFPNYMCEVCGKPLLSETRHKIHMSTHITGTFPCLKCDKVFHSQNSRNAHAIEHRSTKYSCPQCNEKFMRYAERTEHLANVHSVVHRMMCAYPNCGKEFIHYPTYRAHLRSHGNREKKVECPLCGMRFHTKYALSKHNISHTGERPFECKVCGKCYGRKNTLREHMRIHENDRRHVCAECGMAFVQKCSLKGHMKSRHPHVVWVP